MNIRDYAKHINYTNSEIEQTFHQYNVLFHLSDSVSDILYILEMENGSCSQSLIDKLTLVSRKTISSALIKMKKEGLIEITKRNGKENTISLTEKGTAYLKETEAKITDAETRVYQSWKEEDIVLYEALSRRFAKGLQAELKKMKEMK